MPAALPSFLLIRSAATRAALTLALVATGGAALAADPVQRHNSTAVWFENWVGLSNAIMTVSAPDGTVTEVTAASGTPVYDLPTGGQAVDGVYRYEISAATQEVQTIKNPIDNGRGDAARDTVAVPFHTGGQFTVDRGVIITPEEITEEEQG